MTDINYGSIATQIGLAKLNNAVLLDKPINITQIKLGDSNGIEYTPDGSETDLKNVVYSGSPNSIVPDPNNPNDFASMELIVPSDTESFYVREMGCYDGDDLIYIAAIAPRFKPQTSAQSVDMSFEIMVKVLNADNIVIKVDPSITIASRDFVDEEFRKHKTDPDAHPEYLKIEDLPDFDEQLQTHIDAPDPHDQYVLKKAPSKTGVATFTNTSNNINLLGIGSMGLDIGDVISITNSVSNNKDFTVESIVDSDNIVVNYEHRGGTTTKSLINESTNPNVTITLLAKYYNAPLGLGQGWTNTTSKRSINTTYQNTTNRTIKVASNVDNSTLLAGIDVGGNVLVFGFMCGETTVPHLSEYNFRVSYKFSHELR